MAADDAVADRLSSLPQPIWTHILSLLPTRDAVATGLLSRRWRRRWHHLPHLDLDPAAFYPSTDGDGDGDGDGDAPCGATCQGPQFAAFVDLVLPACAVRRSLRRLALRPACDCRSWGSGTERWIRLGMAGRRLSTLELDFSRFPWDYTLGGGAYSYSYGLGPIPAPETLEDLRLLSCVFDPAGFGTFAALKTLVLSSVVLHGGDPTWQCPLLETLAMSGCQVKGGSLEIRHGHLRRLELDRTTFDWMGTAVEVDTPALEAMSASGLLLCEALAVRGSPRLRSLVVENCFAGKEEALGVSLEVEAPGVRRFRFVGAVGRDCSMRASPHLDDVELEVHPWREEEDGDNSRWVGELLKGVSCARSLTLSAGCCLQYLTTETLPNPFHNLKVLKLEVGLVSEELPGIACLLRSSPNLQTLSISLGDESHNASTDSVSLDYELQNLDQLYGDYWESQESPINCLVHHLKRIEISNYRGKRLEEELARFLVTNAMVLKEMPISTLTSSFSGFDFL